MSLQPLHQHNMERRGSQFYSDRVLTATEVAANKAQAEAVVCDRCGKQVHPTNWMKHQNSDHSDDPKPLHKVQKDDHLPLAAIRMDGGTQPRAAINDETVVEYAEEMNNGAKFPAIVVFFDGQEYWLADGFHRVNAAKLLAWLDLPAEVHQGTQRDAVLFSVGVNATHGLRRTNADKRRAVDRLLRDEEWVKWSNNEIARRCSVSHTFVNNVRKEASHETVSSDERTYTTKHGTQATMQTSNIGKPAPTWKDEASRTFAPVTRPPAVSYGKLEDSYQDDVPSVDVDDEDLSGDEWINKALAGELPVTQPVTFQVGDTVSTKFGRTGGKVIELHDELGVMVHFEGYSPWWMKADVLVLTKRGNGTPKEPITEADYELPETATFKVGDKIRTINGHREGIVVKVDGVDAYRTYVEMRNGERYWTDAHWLELSDTNVIAQARADLEHITDSPAKQRLTTIVDQQEKADADRQQRLANWQEHERRRTLAAQTPPPQGQYRTIVIDPPWPMKKIERGVRPNQGTYLDYPTMQLRDIYALGIEQLAADDGCHLYLWTTHKFLPEALKLTSHWGFRYNCLMTWVKTSGMTPYHYRFNTEHVLFATRGSMAVQRKGLSLAFEGDSLGHSRKPDTFYDMIAQASPGPRIDMFARCERAGFSLWGFESELS